MALKAGDKLGSFEILSAIGAGGQGEVYKARDTRLDRFVAIKVLPAHLSARPELRERFEREARTVSRLNHPHICTLHDIGVQDGVHFLVMEYLEGETLADRLVKGSLPLADVLRYAIEIADALEKAHRQGVVHRDLKPGNIMLTTSGAKLLDFGLARQSPAVSPSGVGNPSALTQGVSPLTAEGTILGTLQYMSPEQIEGHEIDARSDVFAFGAVLYEMLTGRRAFEGKSQVGLMASILQSDPPSISSSQPVSPKPLDRLVTVCLAKDPNDRWAAMSDVLLQLRWIAETAEETELAVTSVDSRKPQRVWMGVAAVFVLVSAALAIFIVLMGKAPSPPKISFDIETSDTTTRNQIALSPDGKHLAALVNEKGSNMLWVRALENLDGEEVSGTADADWPFWSPDERHVAFFADGKLKKVDIFGAPTQTLCDAETGRGGSWNSDDVIIFGSAAGPLFRIPAAGGVPTPLTELDKSREEISHRHPMFLPDGRHFIFLAISAKPENSAIYAGSLDSKTRTRLLSSSYRAMFASPAHILFMRDTTLMAQSFDANHLILSGEPFPVVDGVGNNPSNGAAGFTASANGILAYRTGASQNTQLLWFDRNGKQVGNVVSAGWFQFPVISPDLQRVAVFKGEGAAGNIWIKDLFRGTDAKFTFNPGTDNAPLWSPDGSRIVFESNRNGGLNDLYQKNSGGVGNEEILLKSDHWKRPLDWSLDGRFILYVDQDPTTGYDLWVLPMTSDGKPGKAEPVLRTPFSELQGQFSPDGKWIAYASDESSAFEVYVQNFPISGTKYLISTNGGFQPRWRRDGKELFFLSPKRELMSVEIGTSKDDVFHAGVPQKLFQTEGVSTTGRNSYDVTPDGQRFLINSSSASSTTFKPITVIVNWMQGQATRVP